MEGALTYFNFVGYSLGIVAIVVLAYRAKWQRYSDKNIQIEAIPRAGKKYYLHAPVIAGMVEVPPDKKTGRPGKSWPVDDFVTHKASYPPDFPLPWLRADIDEITVYDWIWEPMSPPESDPLMSPSVVYNHEHEMFTQIFMMASQLMAEYEQKIAKALAKSINPRVMYALMGAAILASVASVYITYTAVLPVITRLEPMIEQIEFLAKAFGG